MAWTLTTARKIALFEALEVPYSTSYNTLSGVATLSAQTDVSGASQAAAKTSIENYLAAATAADGENELITYLDRWIAIGTKVANVQGGSVGDLQGVTMNYEDEKRVLRERIKILVPYYKHHEVLAKQMGVTGISIPIMRI
jgi:hypothetical protein